VRVVAVVEQGWDPTSIEVDPVTGAIDWGRAAAAPVPGSLEGVELALALGAAAVYGLGPGAAALLRRCRAMAGGTVPVAVAPDLGALAAAVVEAAADLVLVPQRSGDGGASPVGPFLAGLLDLPQATGVERLEADAAEVRVSCRLDRGWREELVLNLPAVVALEPGLVHPRLPEPAALVAARAAEVPVLPATPGPRPVLLGHQPPRPVPPRVQLPEALDLDARLEALLGGGGPASREVATGSPEEVAGRVLDFLAERGYRPRRRRTRLR
jgi:electron transfer flavoprotein beta subunit